MNLIVNARDAMPNGGTVTITMESVERPSEVKALPKMAGPYVVLSVTDTGIGMDAVTKSHLFEPFFTTKRHGEGTGLGLSTVYGIVKQNGGEVFVDTELGRGSTFRVYLPRADELAPPTSDGLVEPPSATRGDETILVVEDESAVRAFIVRELKKLGYNVLDAADAIEAFTLSAGYDGLIHLLLTDVIMPGFSGRELGEKLISSRPNLKLLYMSGYTDSVLGPQNVLGTEINFLLKPFTPTVLAHKVRTVLKSS